ncbi:hypothetical protein Tco_1243951 [Tanacetum coccineum]
MEDQSKTDAVTGAGHHDDLIMRLRGSLVNGSKWTALNLTLRQHYQRLRPASMAIPPCKEAKACKYGSGTENPPWLQLRGRPTKIRVSTHQAY